MLKNPLPILVEESLNQGDYKIDSLHLQTHLDIERLIDLASRWDDNKLIEIIATNQNDYKRTFDIINAFLYCSRIQLTIRKFLPKYISTEQTQFTLIARTHERAHWGTEKIYAELR